MPTITIGSSANVLEASENKGPKISFFSVELKVCP